VVPFTGIAQPDRSVNDSTAPYAHDLFIQGVLINGYTVTGSYLYTSPLGIPEGNSLYRWYTADSIGAAWVPVDSAWTVNYTIDSLDIGKYLVFEVTPIAQSGDSVGEPATVYSSWPVGGVGIHESEPVLFTIYPNPARGMVAVETDLKNTEISISEMNGRILLQTFLSESGTTILDLHGFASGVYLLRVTTEDGRNGARILVHQ
jgi:hypothetical protein